MKKSHLKQFIKEEIRSVLKESINESDNWKTVKIKSGDTLKPGKKYTMPRYDGEITFIKFDRDNKTMHLKSNKIGKIRTSIDNAKDMVLVKSINEGSSQFKHAVQKALKANGYNLKQSEVKIGAKKVRGMGTKITLNGEMIGFDDEIPKMIANFTKAIKDDPKKYGLKESVNEGFLADLPTWVWTLSYAAPFLWMTWEILVSGFEDGKLRRKLSPSGWVELIKLFLKKSKTKQIINTLSQDPEIKSMMGDVKSGKEKQWKLKNLLSKKMSDKQKDVVKQEFDSIAKRLLNKESVNEGEKEALLGDPKMDKAWAKKVDGLSKSQLQKEKDRLHKAGFGHGNQWSGSKENMVKFKYVDQLLKESINEDKEWSSYEQRMVNQIKAAKKEGLGMYQLPMKTQDFYRKHKDKFDESINEDQFEASLDDKQKYKMGSMWFKRWFKPKKEQDGWTWEDDGRYIWLTRPKMKHPTVRFEKETGFLQGNWKDPREMQWE